MITVEQHLAHVLGALAPLPARTVPLADAYGCVLAEDVVARLAVPPFDNSAMDGYAVRSDDVAAASAEHPVQLRVVGDVPAGSTARPVVEPGTAVRIMTGAPVPPGADAVVPVEDTDQPPGPGAGKALPGVVLIARGPVAGRHVRRAQEDVAPGDLVLRGGTVLGARHLSAAASVGYGALRVHPRPRVGVLATGAELVAPGEPLRHGQIPDSNSTLMRGLVREAGVDPVDLGAVDDTPDALRRVLDQALGRVDAIVTSGGVSAGAYDVIKEVLEPLGAVRFVKVAMQPGKPQGFGLLEAPGAARSVPLFALPGNPVSVFVSFHVLVRPALAKIRGGGSAVPLRDAVAAVGWTSPPGRQQYVPVVLDAEPDASGRVRVRPATSGGSGSHLVASLALADALAVVDPQIDRVDAGDAVRVMMIS